MEILKRIEDKIIKTETCWLWTACKDEAGYGQAKLSGKMQRAHRILWELANGQIPKGMLVLHRCDVRNCVNPKHLFLGTQTDNMKDMYSKGREPKKHGEFNGNSKLKWDDVKIIRSLWPKLSTYKIGNMYGVTNTLIHQIVKNKIWKEI